MNTDSGNPVKGHKKGRLFNRLFYALLRDFHYLCSFIFKRMDKCK